MKRIALAFVQRLFVAIAILLAIGLLGLACGRLFGPSKFAGSALVVLVAWPWALPQIFIGVCIVWFVALRISRHRAQRHA